MNLSDLSEEEILELINQGEESAQKVNNLFLNAGISFLDVNAEFIKNNQIWGEIDGICYFDKTIILIEATKQRGNLTQKMADFFTKWSDDENIEIIRRKYKKPRKKIKRVFFDLAHDYREPPRSREHIVNAEGNYVLYRNDLKYFQKYFEIAGKHVRSEILSSLKFHSSDVAEVFALINYIRNQKVYLFSMPVKTLLDICYVTRRRNREGYQRILKKRRIDEIRETIQNNLSITFPNSIIVTTIKPIKVTEIINDDVVKILLPAGYCSVRVIDGQHRLLGFTKLEDNLLDHYNLVVVALDKIDQDKEIQTFIDINDNQKRVDKNLLYVLQSRIDYSASHKFYDKKIAVKVAQKLNEGPPYKNKIFFGEVEYDPQPPITLVALVNSLTRNKIVSRNSIFQLDRDDINGYTRRIKNILLRFQANELAIDLIRTNLGIRLLFRLVLLVHKNIAANKFPKTLKEFIDDFCIITDNNFIREIKRFYGLGGANNAAEEVIATLRRNFDEYNEFEVDLRELNKIIRQLHPGN